MRVSSRESWVVSTQLTADYSNWKITTASAIAKVVQIQMHTQRLNNIQHTATTVLLYFTFTKKVYWHFNNLNKTRQIIRLLFERYNIFADA